MVNQRSPQAEQVIKILGGLPQISFSGDDITKLLTAPEITEIIRYLENENPGMAELIRDSQRQFSREDKFAVRQILLGMACAIAVLVDETPQKAVSALME